MDIRVRQDNSSGCGAACLVSVGRYYDLDLQISQIRQIAGTDETGTNILGMIEAAVSFGFEAKGVRGTFESLFNIPLPSIAHVLVNGILPHFVVISCVTEKNIQLMDPGKGKLYYKRHHDFQKEWTGVLILLVPSEK